MWSTLPRTPYDALEEREGVEEVQKKPRFIARHSLSGGHVHSWRLLLVSGSRSEYTGYTSLHRRSVHTVNLFCIIDIVLTRGWCWRDHDDDVNIMHTSPPGGEMPPICDVHWLCLGDRGARPMCLANRGAAIHCLANGDYTLFIHKWMVWGACEAVHLQRQTPSTSVLEGCHRARLS